MQIKQSCPYLEKSDFNYIEEIIRNQFIAQGKFVDELQEEFSSFLGTTWSIATSSGTTALHLALLSLNIKEGDEVIIPSYTCSALMDAVNYVRAVPILADIDTETFNMTHAILKRKISKRTKAIILTHTFGFPADIVGISKLGIPIIEDCAHSIGSLYKGRHTGSQGTTSIFSFYATKMLAAGEGGMVCTNDSKIAETIHDLNTPNMRESYRVRYNYKMSDLNAGLALNQMRKLDFFVKRRKEIAEIYKKSFSVLPVKLQMAIEDTIPNYYRFIICTSKAKEVIDYCNLHDVICDRPVMKPLHFYLNRKENENYAGTEYVWNSAVSIPIYPALRTDEVNQIIDTILKYF